MKQLFPFLFLAAMGLGFFSGCKGTKTVSSSEQPDTSTESAVAEALPTPVSSLLWEISGNYLEQPSYLYGTIHIIGSNDYFMSDAVVEAFNASELLALEIDMDDPQMMRKMMSGMMMEDEQTLEDLLSPEDYELVHNFLLDSAEVPKIGIKQIERMMPMLALSAAYPKMIDGDMRSYEQEFMNMAKENDLEIVGVEKIEDQLAVIGQIPYEEQATMLLEYAKDFAAQKVEMARMIEIYRSQDIDGMLALMEESDTGTVGDFEEILLEQRNRNWIPVIGDYASKQTTFFAVGAGHLAGETGVIKLLRDAGYTVEPVM